MITMKLLILYIKLLYVAKINNKTPVKKTSGSLCRQVQVLVSMDDTRDKGVSLVSQLQNVCVSKDVEDEERWLS